MFLLQQVDASAVLDPQESFELLYALLKDYSDTYVNYTITTTASILLVVGWLLTSEQARAFIGREPRIKILLTVLAAVVFVIEVAIGFRVLSHSSDIIALIGELPLRGLKPGYYEPRRVTSTMVYSFLGGHLLMYCFLLALVWSIRSSTNSVATGTPKPDEIPLVRQ